MQFMCSQCNTPFRSLNEFLEHVKTHGIEPQSCLDGIEVIVRKTISHFYPGTCPHCKRPLNYEDYISEEDITKFLKKLREGL